MFIRSYHLDWREELGLEEGEPLTYRAVRERVPWMKFKSLKRLHLVLSTVLKHLMQGQPLVAGAYASQAMKCLEQVAADKGSWKHGWNMTGLKDPTDHRVWLGTMGELEMSVAVNEAHEKVHRQAAGGKGVREAASSDSDEEGEKKKKKKKKKKHEEKKEE
jgi:hypothetical protein